MYDFCVAKYGTNVLFVPSGVVEVKCVVAASGVVIASGVVVCLEVVVTKVNIFRVKGTY